MTREELIELLKKASDGINALEKSQHDKDALGRVVTAIAHLERGVAVAKQVANAATQIEEQIAVLKKPTAPVVSNGTAPAIQQPPKPKSDPLASTATPQP